MDIEINDTLNKIESKKQELDNFRDRFIDQCRVFASTQFDDLIDSAIRSNPEKIQELGVEGIAPIKQEVQEAKASLDSFVDKLLYEDDIWLYKQEEATPDNCPFHKYHVRGNRLPEVLEEPVKMLLSPAGEILVKHALTSNEQWEKSGDMMRYRYGYSPTATMKDTLNEFNEKFDEFYRLLEQLQEYKRQKASNEAKDLWDKS